MRILLDTNVLIAAFISHGVCSELLEHCSRRHILITSQFILEEFRGKLLEKFGFSDSEAQAAVRLLLTRMEVVAPPPLPTPACRDADDDNVLAAAIAGACDCIVTGDKDLLDLRAFQAIQIASPGQFWRRETQEP